MTPNQYSFSLSLARRLRDAERDDAFARASAAVWLEQARTRAYLAAVACEAPAASSEPPTARLRRVA